MAVHFNHTILSASDSKASAKFLTEMLNLPAPKHWGPFEMVVTDNGAYLDYMDKKAKEAAAAERAAKGPDVCDDVKERALREAGGKQ